jgi:threonine dehydrogenase-like Zn-dependent dehydrogenase
MVVGVSCRRGGNHKIGDRVVVNPIFSCGVCDYCSKGKGNLCPEGGLLGRERNGTYAEYVCISEHLAFKFPENISYEEASAIELLATVYHGQRKAAVLPGETVAKHRHTFQSHPAGHR